MPACGADALYARWVGVGGGRPAHHRRPVVQIAVGGHIAFIVVRGVTVGVGIAGAAAGGYFRVVGIVRGAQVLLHPALVANLYRIIDVAVHVGDSRRAYTGLGIVVGTETHLIAICSTHTIRGVRPHIVGGDGRKTGKVARKRPCAGAVFRVAVGNGGILRGTPTNATCGNRSAAVIHHVSSTCGRSGQYIRGIIGSNGGQDGINRYGYTCRSSATIRVYPRHRVDGGGSGRYRNRGSGSVCTPLITVRARSRERGALSVVDRTRTANTHHHGVTQGGKDLLLSIARTRAIGSVCSYIVGSVWRKSH